VYNIYIYFFFIDLLSSDITSYNFNAKDMCIMNKNSYDIEQCNITDIICDKSDDDNLTNCDNAIEEIREDTNVPRNVPGQHACLLDMRVVWVIVTELNLSDPNSNKYVQFMTYIYKRQNVRDYYNLVQVCIFFYKCQQFN